MSWHNAILTHFYSRIFYVLANRFEHKLGSTQYMWEQYPNMNTKRIAIPLVSLLVTIIFSVITIFVVLMTSSSFTNLVQGQAMSASSRYDFLYYCAMNTSILKIVARYGLGLSFASSILTFLLLCVGEPRRIINDHLKYTGQMLFISTISQVVLLISIAGSYFFGPFFGLQSPINLGIVQHLLQNLLINITRLTLIVGVVNLIGIAVLYTSVRLYTRCTSPVARYS